MEEIKKSKLKNIIWLDDPTKFDYVRMSNFLTHSLRCKPIKKQEEQKYGLKLIGYENPKLIANLSNGADRDFPIYKMIYFWLKSYDRGMPRQNIKRGYGTLKELHPSEAVKIIN